MCVNINSLASVVASGLITYYQCYLFPKGAVRELSLSLARSLSTSEKHDCL